MTKSRPNILVVDDTPANLQLLAGLLKERGFKARPVPSGRLALQAARSQVPDLILLDINMPEMDGYEVCRQLKQDEELRDVPVLFLSALNDTVDKVRAFREGGVDYITKPFQFEEVEARVETHLLIRHQQLELQRIHREQESFLRHELTNYLTAIFAYNELLLETTDRLDDDQKEWLDHIRQAVKRMTAFVSEVKKLNEFERGIVQAKKAPCDLDAIVTSAIDDLEPTFKNCRIECRTTSNQAIIAADPQLLQGVFHNLIKNALEHVEELETERERTVTVDVRDSGDQAVVSINNRGPALPDDLLRHFFEKFNSSRKPGGTGLGTTYAYLVTHAHGGEIAVSSNQDDGTTLTVSFDAITPSGDALPA